MGVRAIVAFGLVGGCGRIGFDNIGPIGGDAATAASCTDASKDGDETGIDCGGSCLACPGAPCGDDGACVTGSCIGNTCELASSPPFWLAGPDLASPRTGVRCALDDDDGGVLVIGGNVGATFFATTELLVGGASGFVPGPTMLAARADHAVAKTADGTLYAFGGNDMTGALPSLEALVSSAWTPRAADMIGHSLISGTAGLDGNVYVVDDNSLEIYSPASDSWSSAEAPTDARDSAGVARGSDALIYAIGGHNAVGDAVFADVDAWDTSSATWQSRASLPTARMDDAAVAADDGRIYAIGGNTSSSDLADVVAYAIDQDRWVDVASLATPRTDACAAAGSDGRLYVAGGGNDVGTLQSVEIYGPAIALSPTSAARGDTVEVDGSNFAATAAVAVTLDGTPVAIGTTDNVGHVALSFRVPATASGIHAVVGLDDRSQFPTSAPLQVQ